MSEEWYEKCQEKLDGDKPYYIASDADGSQNFLIWIEEWLGEIEYGKLLDKWLATKDGQAWYAKMLDKLYRDVPDGPEDDPMEDR